jgi:hypothetical protein
MRMTYLNLRFGVLVGIGGGVPVKTDNGTIQLGDVVVSKPSSGHSGAVQYDHGKVETGQFRRTGVLAPPLAVLLNAAQDLAAKRARLRKDPVVENIKRFNTDIRGLRKYKNPGSAQDHLYRPDYVHLNPRVSCEECGCDPAQRVQRAIDANNDDPYVVAHRGSIASSGMVIKTANYSHATPLIGLLLACHTTFILFTRMPHNYLKLFRTSTPIPCWHFPCSLRS